MNVRTFRCVSLPAAPKSTANMRVLVLRPAWALTGASLTSAASPATAQITLALCRPLSQATRARSGRSTRLTPTTYTICHQTSAETLQRIHIRLPGATQQARPRAGRRAIFLPALSRLRLSTGASPVVHSTVTGRNVCMPSSTWLAVTISRRSLVYTPVQISATSGVELDRGVDVAFEAYYLLVTTCYLLSTTDYLLVTTYHLPLTTYHLPLITYYLLLTTYYLLLTGAFLARRTRSKRADCRLLIQLLHLAVGCLQPRNCPTSRLMIRSRHTPVWPRAKRGMNVPATRTHRRRR